MSNNPNATMVPYQGLLDPGTPEPSRVPIDVSTMPWAGDAATLGHVGRELVSAPPALKSHVVRHKGVAAVRAAEGLYCGDFLPQLRKATESGRTALAKLDADLAAAKATNRLTPSQLEGMDALQAAPRAMSKHQMQAAASSVASALMTKLNKAEQEATKAITDRPGPQVTAADYSAASELHETLSLMPPSIAIPLLVQRLVEQPAKSGTNLGLTAAMIPLLQSRFSTDPAWNTSPEAHDLLRLCETVVRDASFYTPFMRLNRVLSLKHKVETLTRAYLEADGDELAGSCLAAREPNFFGELGVEARVRPEPEPRTLIRARA